MDFFGSTTPSDFVASVATSLQTTSSNLLVIVALVGIPIAFGIATYVVSLTKRATGATSSREHGPGGAHETYTPEQLTAVSNKILEIESRPGRGYPD